MVPSLSGGDLVSPLDEKGLELADTWNANTIDRYNGGHIGEDVAPGGVKDQPVDGFSEALVAQEGDDDDEGAEEREDGGGPFRGRDGVCLTGCETG